MALELTQSNYNFAIHRLRLLLSEPLKLGSESEIEMMLHARFVEDYEVSRAGKAFEPYYLET